LEPAGPVIINFNPVYQIQATEKVDRKNLGGEIFAG